MRNKKEAPAANGGQMLSSTPELYRPSAMDASEKSAITPLLIDEREMRRVFGGISAKTAFNLRRRGLPFVKLGERVMYAPAALSAWVQQSQQTATQAGDGGGK